MENVLKIELIKAGIKQKEVAKRLDVKPQAVSRKINRKTIVTIEEAFIFQDMIFEKTQKLIPLKELFPLSIN